MSIIEKAMRKFDEHGREEFIKVKKTDAAEASSDTLEKATKAIEEHQALLAEENVVNSEPEQVQQTTTAPQVTEETTASSVDSKINNASAFEQAETVDSDPLAVGGNGLVFQIDEAHLRSQRLLSPAMPRGHLVEEYRSIKRPILVNAFGNSGAQAVDRGNLVMMTSAVAGEGKTYNAVNLAMSVTRELDKTVLLVDADVVNPSVCAALGIPEPEKGLIDLLADPTIDVQDVMIRTSIPNLAVIPAGQRHDRSTELLSGTGMHKLVSELSSRYSDRLVIFDTPPLLMTSEARVLVNLMGQIILVVRAASTGASVIKSVLPIVETHDVVGTILNATAGMSQMLYSGSQS